MYSIMGYECIKSKEGQVFTKVYIAQYISDEKGHKPLPKPFMISGENKSYVPGSPCRIILDADREGNLMISGCEVIPAEGSVIL